MKSNIQLKYRNYVVFSHFHGCAVNNIGTLFEPVKRGKYYFIRITDKNEVEKKRVQIAEERIEKIEYIIEKVEEHE